jgi:hypothetical protein
VRPPVAAPVISPPITQRASAQLPPPIAPPPEEKASNLPKLSLTPRQVRPASLPPTVKSSAIAPTEILHVTEPAAGREGLPGAKRWPIKKSDVAVLGQALSGQQANNSPPPAEPVTVPAIAAQEKSPMTAPEPAQGSTTSATTAQTNPIAAAVPAPPSAERPERAVPTPLAGTVSVLPSAAGPKGAIPANPASGLLPALGPMLPRAGAVPPVVLLMTAERLSSSTFVDALKAPWRARLVGAEFRDFARRELVFEFRSTVLGPRMDVAAQPAALPFTPVTVGSGVTLWVGPSLEFPPIEDHRYALSALDLFDSDRPIDSPFSGLPASEASAKGVAAPRTAPFVGAPGAREPEAALSPLSLDLEGVAGGKAKPVQVFTSTLRAAAVVDIPRYEALPLRPVMVVETAGTSEAGGT